MLFRSTMPTAPNNKVTMAAVIYSDATNGSIEVRPTLGSKLNEDELAELNSLTNGDVLAYVSANGRFENQNTLVSAFNTANAALPKAGGTITGDLAVMGNTTFSGITTYANTQTLLIGDNIITLNNDIPISVAPTEDAGIEVKRGTGANVSIIWNETGDRWTLTNDGTSWLDIATNNTVASANNYAGAMANAVNTYTSATYSTVVQWGSSFNVTNAAFGVANAAYTAANNLRSEEHTSELQSH